MFKRIISAGILTVAALSIMPVKAAPLGFYMAGQPGYAKNHNKTGAMRLLPKYKFSPLKLTKTAKQLRNKGLAERVVVGYQLNRHFAVETGYLQLGHVKKRKVAHTNGDLGSFKLKKNAIDLVGKGMYPLNDKFDVSAKAGVIYLSEERNANLHHHGRRHPVVKTAVTQHQLAPEVGLELGYRLTPNVLLDTSWTHIHPMGKNRNGNLNFGAIGLGYSFG